MAEAETTDAPKKRGRPPKAKPGDADFKPTHRGPQPHFPVFGESWEDSEGTVKFWHGNGWYLAPPGEAGTGAAAIEKMNEAAGASTETAEERAARMGAEAVAGSAAAADAAGPEAERVEGEIVDDAGLEIVDQGEDSSTAGATAGSETENQGGEVEQLIDDDDEELPAVAKIEALADGFEIGDLRYIVADGRDFLLGVIKELPKLWGAMPEAKQYDLARACENAVADLVQRIAEAVATREKLPIRAFLESYVEKDGVKVTLKLKPAGEQEELEAIVGLHKAKGKMVLLTAADSDDYRAERKPQTQPDEPGLAFENGERPHPADDSDLADAADETDYGAGDDA